MKETLGQTLYKAKRLVAQTGNRKAVGNCPKLYNWHAPEVACISKGKSRNPYKFGVKVGLTMTIKGNLIVSAGSFPGNPYDKYTMHRQIEQSAILIQSWCVKPEVVYADLGYRSVYKDNMDIEIKHLGKDKRLTDEERRLLKRRQAMVAFPQISRQIMMSKLNWSYANATYEIYRRVQVRGGQTSHR